MRPTVSLFFLPRFASRLRSAFGFAQEKLKIGDGQLVGLETPLVCSFCRPFFTANKPEPPFFAGRDLEPRSLMDLGILDRTELFLWDGLQVCHSDAHPGGADILTRDSQRNDLTGKCGLLGRCVMRTTVIHSPPIPQD